MSQSKNPLNASKTVTSGAKALIAAIDMDFRYTFFNQGHHDELKRLTGKDIKIGMTMIDVLSDIRTDLNELIRDAINDLTVIEEKEAKIELGELPAAEVDPPQFRQLIGNLINNAIKFNRSSASKVIIRGETDGDLCRILVEDNGIGFDEQYLDRIFTPLHRLHGRSEYEGSGMGLAICAKVVERHGGNITARSRPGEGSTFIVILPLRH